MKKAAPTRKELTPQQERFCQEYVIDLNATAAYKRAGYKGKGRSAENAASRLLGHVGVAARIAELQAKVSEKLEIKAEDVLRRWWDIATADVNDLIEYRRACCRHCYGKGHLYQFTAAELARETTKAAKAGGAGFDARKPPHPDCPECFGEGEGRTFVKDSRELSPQARMLYAGVKLTKDGLHVLTEDRGAALEKVAQHIGMLVRKNEHFGKDGAPLGLTATGVLVVPGQITSMEEWEKLALSAAKVANLADSDQ